MERILRLERELRLNKVNIFRLDGNDDPAAQREYRMLLVQRSNLKDMLLEEYRKELLERRKDIESMTEESGITQVVPV